VSRSHRELVGRRAGELGLERLSLGIRGLDHLLGASEGGDPFVQQPGLGQEGDEVVAELRP
jgi:hypothetical protein